MRPIILVTTIFMLVIPAQFSESGEPAEGQTCSSHRTTSNPSSYSFPLSSSTVGAVAVVAATAARVAFVRVVAGAAGPSLRDGRAPAAVLALGSAGPAAASIVAAGAGLQRRRFAAVATDAEHTAVVRLVGQRRCERERREEKDGNGGDAHGCSLGFGIVCLALYDVSGDKYELCRGFYLGACETDGKSRDTLGGCLEATIYTQ